MFFLDIRTCAHTRHVVLVSSLQVAVARTAKPQRLAKTRAGRQEQGVEQRTKPINYISQSRLRTWHWIAFYWIILITLILSTIFREHLWIYGVSASMSLSAAATSSPSVCPTSECQGACGRLVLVIFATQTSVAQCWSASAFQPLLQWQEILHATCQIVMDLGAYSGKTLRPWHLYLTCTCLSVLNFLS